MVKTDVKQCEYCHDSSICKLWGGIECKPEEYKCPYYIKCLELRLHRYKQAIDEIKELATVNSINTCWAAMNLCVDCNNKKECGLQSPFEKLKSIIQIINEVK